MYPPCPLGKSAPWGLSMQAYRPLLLRRQRRIAQQVGMVCCALLIGVLLPSLFLHCARWAVLTGGVAFIKGSLFGLCLAAITRTRRPTFIYLWLLLALLMGISFWNDWPLSMPVPSLATGTPWGQLLFAGYGILVRYGLFFVGLPAPFALYGQHGPDMEDTPQTKE